MASPMNSTRMALDGVERRGELGQSAGVAHAGQVVLQTGAIDVQVFVDQGRRALNVTSSVKTTWPSAGLHRLALGDDLSGHVIGRPRRIPIP